MTVRHVELAQIRAHAWQVLNGHVANHNAAAEIQADQKFAAERERLDRVIGELMTRGQVEPLHVRTLRAELLQAQVGDVLALGERNVLEIGTSDALQVLLNHVLRKKNS